MSTIQELFASYTDADRTIEETENYLKDLREAKWKAAEDIFNSLSDKGELQGANPFTVEGVAYVAGRSPGKGNHYRVIPLVDPAARKAEKDAEKKLVSGLKAELEALKAEKLALLKERGFDV